VYFVNQSTTQNSPNDWLGNGWELVVRTIEENAYVIFFISILLISLMSEKILLLESRYIKTKREAKKPPYLFVDALYHFSLFTLIFYTFKPIELGIFETHPSIVVGAIVLFMATVALISGVVGGALICVKKVLGFPGRRSGYNFIKPIISSLHQEFGYKVFFPYLKILTLIVYDEIRCYLVYLLSLFSYYPKNKNINAYKKEIHEIQTEQFEVISKEEKGLSKSDKIARYFKKIFSFSSSPFLVDEVNSSVDYLNRKAVVERLFKVILNSGYTSSSARIALHGEWGEGKTHVISNLIDKINIEARDKFIIISVSAWAYLGEEKSNTVNLVKGIYSDIQRRINQEFYVPEFQAAFSEYVKAIAGVNLSSPHIPFSLRLSLKDNLSEQTTKDLQQKISDAIEGIGRKLLIIIDDIDRLHAKEILAIFQIVRENLNFKNTVFLLAYDPTEVRNQLKQSSINESYIEKIVQSEIKLPEYSYQQIVKYIRFELAEKRTMLGIPEYEDVDQDMLHEAIDAVFNGGYKFIRHFIRNLRHAKRLINGLLLHYPPVAMEVNLEQFIKLEILRQHKPQVYADIVRDPNFYLEEFTSDKKDGTSIFLRNIPGNDHMTERLITDLFPPVSSSRSNKKSQSISDPKYFPRFFRDSLPEEQIGDIEISIQLNKWMGLDELQAAEDVHNYFIEKQSEDKLLVFVQDMLGKLSILEKQSTTKISLLLIREICASESRYDKEKTLLEADFVFETLSDLVCYLPPETFKSEVPKIVDCLSIYHAFNFSQKMVMARKSNVGLYYSQHNKHAPWEVFEDIKPPLYKRFQEEIIDRNINFFDYFERPAQMWFMLQDGSEFIDLESYMIGFIQKSKDKFIQFIHFYTIFDELNQEALSKFNQKKLFIAMKEASSKFHLSDVETQMWQWFSSFMEKRFKVS
jgi:Cdc6-like AAA superfamily ATPase